MNTQSVFLLHYKTTFVAQSLDVDNLWMWKIKKRTPEPVDTTNFYINKKDQKKMTKKQL